MPLAAGTRLNHYEIYELIGKGGMGEVYRAADTKLKRDVALKILPQQFDDDSARLTRFEREAQVLASLNHPNIAAIHGLEEADGINFLVLELVEGPTLAEKIASGAVPVPEALRIGAAIAEALEAAHEKPVIHRDLKPANVKITPQGKVKVLDFGLAKAYGETDPVSIVSEDSETRTLGATRTGVVMGTPAYMSPEQAQGLPLDKRSDVWSFGVVLYEMLTGRRLFQGKSTEHVLIHVMEQDPDWSALPATVPVGLREMLERCLRKDPAERHRDIGDVRLQLQDFGKQPTTVRTEAVRPPPGSRWKMWSGAAAAGAIMLVVGLWYLRPAPPPVQQVGRFEISPPEASPTPPVTPVTNSGSAVAPPAPAGRPLYTRGVSISPDGSRLAFITQDQQAIPRLWVRRLDSLESRPLYGTERVTGIPFWSADGKFIAFSSNNKLRKVEASGGPVQIICDIPSPLQGGFWTRDNKLVYGHGGSPLVQVSADGGTPTPVTRLDESRGERLHAVPSLLPDGKHFVYARSGPRPEARGIYVGSLDVKPEEQSTVRLLPDATPIVFASSPNPNVAYLVLVRQSNGSGNAGTLMAQPFDTRRLQTTGTAISIAEPVADNAFAASSTGVLVYRLGEEVINPLAQNGQLTWLDRQGRVLSTVGEPGLFFNTAPTLSPDGKRVVFSRNMGQGADLWVFEFARGVANRFTFDPRGESSPIWSPDGSRIIFGRAPGQGQGAAAYQKLSDQGGDEELLLPVDTSYRGVPQPTSISPDGRFLLLFYVGPNTPPADVLVASLDVPVAERKPVPYIKSDANERAARFSPNGRWVAYSSDESGGDEVYVRPFDPAHPAPAAGGKWMVSKGGGGGVHWRADGKELFYVRREDSMVMSVEVSTGAVFQAGVPKPLFKTPMIDGRYSFLYDVSTDGKRFLFPMPVPKDASAPPAFTVVLNWTSTLKQQ